MWLLPDEQKKRRPGRSADPGEWKQAWGKGDEGSGFPWAPTQAGGEGPPAPARAWHRGLLWGGGGVRLGKASGAGPEGGQWRWPEPAREGLRLLPLLGWAGGARPVAAEQLRNLFS